MSSIYYGLNLQSKLAQKHNYYIKSSISLLFTSVSSSKEKIYHDTIPPNHSTLKDRISGGSGGHGLALSFGLLLDHQLFTKELGYTGSAGCMLEPSGTRFARNLNAFLNLGLRYHIY